MKKRERNGKKEMFLGNLQFIFEWKEFLMLANGKQHAMKRVIINYICITDFR